MQRQDRAEKSAGERQTDRRDIGRELTKAEEYPSMKKAMELLRDGLRINLMQDARQTGAQRSGALPTHKMEISANCPSSRNLTQREISLGYGFTRETCRGLRVS